MQSLEEDFKSFKRNSKYTENSDDDKRACCEFKSIVEFAKQHNGLISIHAGSKSNGVDEKISNAVKFNEAIKESYAKDVDIFEMGKLKDCEEYEEKVFTDKFFLEHGKKPMIICSDNHDPRKYSLEDKTTWIKSELTFEGLRQILFEPEDRVKIQKEEPDSDKASYNVIDYIEGINNDKNDIIQSDRIYFNKNLNCIIGGKSTGKSMLLYNIVASVDIDELEKRGRKENVYEDYNIDLNVVWNDGKKAEHRIIYIPQSYLKDELDKGKDKKINEIVKEYLLSDDKFAEIYKEYENDIKNNENNIKKCINFIEKKFIENLNYKNELDKLGSSKVHNDEAEILKNKINEYKLDDISEEKLKKYYEEKIKIEEKKEQIKNNEEKSETIDKLNPPNIIFKDFCTCGTETGIEDGWDEVVDNDFSESEYPEVCKWINQKEVEIKDSWLKEKRNIIDAIKVKNGKIKIDIETNEKEFENIEKIMKNNEELTGIKKKLFEENSLLKQSLEYEKKIAENQKEIEQKYKDLYNNYNEYKSIFDSFKSTFVEIEKNNEKDDLQFDIEYVPKEVEIDNLLHYIDKRYIQNFDIDFSKETISLSAENIEKLLTPIDYMNNLKNNYTKFDFMRYLFVKPDEIKYETKSEGDSIYKTSQGKKAKIILDLIIKLSPEKCPILIDQPEDDLDNRSIYTELVQYIKNKKKDRQIIIVTHNANLVIGSDAEEIIIANQTSESSPNEKYRFEYRVGCIENNRIEGENPKSILRKTEFQKQVCDILEGGKDAFKNRESKYYSMKNN